MATVVAAVRPHESNPLMVEVGQQRRFTTVDLRLDDLRIRRGRLSVAELEALLTCLRDALVL